MFRRLIPLLLILLITPFTLSAQEEEHPPQFLYRDGDQLVLVSITGEASETVTLPNVTAGNARDRFEWSPDGRYLLSLIVPENEIYLRCMNLYDTDRLEWVYTEPMACGVHEAAFSHDARSIAYSINAGDNEQLRLHSLVDNRDQFLTQTVSGTEVYATFISDLVWSPNDHYLTWAEAHEMMGGGRSTLRVRSLSTGSNFSIIGGSGFYASYTPVWSLDGEWFLVVLKEEYVGVGDIPITLHQGDLYIVEASNGETYRLTYTPAVAESNYHWTNDNRIAFETIQSIELSIEDAIQIPEPAPESIIQPPTPNAEDWDADVEFRADYEDFVARVVRDETLTPVGVLVITRESGGAGLYLVALTEWYDYAQESILFGWRPSPNADS